MKLKNTGKIKTKEMVWGTNSSTSYFIPLREREKNFHFKQCVSTSLLPLHRWLSPSMHDSIAIWPTTVQPYILPLQTNSNPSNPVLHTHKNWTAIKWFSRFFLTTANHNRAIDDDNNSKTTLRKRERENNNCCSITTNATTTTKKMFIYL